MKMARRKTGRAPRRRRKPIRKGPLLWIFFLSLAAALTGGAFVLFEGEKPTIIQPDKITHLGGKRKIAFTVQDKRSGIREVKVLLNHGGKTTELYSKAFDRRGYFSRAGETELSDSCVFDYTKSKIQDGPAELLITARDFSLRGLLQGNRTELRIPVTVDTKPPKISIIHSQRYIRPGGSGIVVYSISEPAGRHGVVLDDLFFPGYPLKANGGKQFVAYIGLPWNTKKVDTSQVMAVDLAGNQGKTGFRMKIKKVTYKKDRINVGDAFLKRKVPEFQEHYPEMSGTLLERYLFVNNEVRRRNNEQIKKICSKSGSQRLWENSFTRMPGAGRAGFADQRTYYYQGKPVDHQVHLGMDIASTARVEIKAANRGQVSFADYLGIYGNTVILDHGQGVCSLYSHLSRIDVQEGDSVESNTVIGRSGATGMAGGDHLHFSMLVNGIFVTPVEWWDQHWIDVNINDVL